MHLTLKWPLKRYLFIAALLGIVFLMLMGFSHRTYEATLSNEVVIQITRASTFASFSSKTSCKIAIRKKDGIMGTINLLQDSDSCLAMVMPAADGKHLLFLYDADVHYRLMRLDLNQQSTRFSSDSYLNYIVLSSPWSIEEGTSNDWQEAHSYLKMVPQDVFNRLAITTCDFGLVRLRYGRRELLSEVEREIYNSQHGWVY